MDENNPDNKVIPPAPPTESSELSSGPDPATEVCSNPSCSACVLVNSTLLAFEAAVVSIIGELQKDKKNLLKLDLLIGVAADVGSAFTRIERSVDLSKVAVADAKARFIKTAILMNQNYEAIKHLQMLAGISRIN